MSEKNKKKKKWKASLNAMAVWDLRDGLALSYEALNPLGRRISQFGHFQNMMAGAVSDWVNCYRNY